MSQHEIYEALYQGFLDRSQNFPSKIDDYIYFTGPYYETGRHLAEWLSVIDYDISTINKLNIFSLYSKFRNEIYQNGKRSRTRNA